ncbi:hypothetical protein [Actinoplanes palleronii]|uniref:Uncharacterized protein n=1 Tax=Actinoplanes palleronii TaxID=113570 RepID=A0ABQ4B2E8_9ACTN|nr:hypothetical protein [Actinoplanes palleronii]GIE64830.1 hypothetical protein Apa02nite_009380 [Actinoplanes palleronii]
MMRRKYALEELRRFALRTLEASVPGDRWVRRSVADFFRLLVDVHALIPDFDLRDVADGSDFYSDVVAQLQRLRSDVQMAADWQVDEIEEASDEQLELALRIRSGLQYLHDDFADTAAAGLVDERVLAEADAATKDLLDKYGPAEPDDVPAFVPVSHWWWDSSFRAAMPDWVTVYRYGEAPDDLSTAFYIADRAYSRPWLALAARQEASSFFSDRDLIREVLRVEGSAGYLGGALPTWDQFRQRHVVDGVPLPVRSVPQDYVPPPGWDAMMAEIQRERDAVFADLQGAAAEAFPNAPTQVNSVEGPMRFSRGAVQKHEELWGFRINFMAFPGFPDSVPPAEEIAAVSPKLSQRGWVVASLRDSPGELHMEAARGEFRLSVFAEPGAVTFIVLSPRYRAPLDMGPIWIIEPRVVGS